MTDSRQPCIVPHCRRTRVRGQSPEWICGPHWTAVPAKYRRAYNRRRRRVALGGYTDPRQIEAVCRLWRRVKVCAIEAAAGIG